MSFNLGDHVRLNDKYFRVDPEAPASLVDATGTISTLPLAEGSTYVVTMDDEHGPYGRNWLFLEDELEPVAS